MKLMVVEFSLSMDRHINLLYPKDFFFARMMTIGHSKSIKSYVKRFLNFKTSLIDFVNQICQNCTYTIFKANHFTKSKCAIQSLKDF